MRLHLLAALPVALIACSGNGPSPDGTAATPPIAVTPGGTPSPSPSATATPPATVVDGQPFGRTVIADFDAPWAMTFLPDRRMLVTEKDGRMLLVGADGSVQNCAVAKSGGDKVFQDATCRAATARARSKPAIGADGQPIASVWIRRINWKPGTPMFVFHG